MIEPGLEIVGRQPVGDERDAMTAVLDDAERRHQLVQLRHAVGLRPLKTHDHDDIAKKIARAERGVQFLLAVEHLCRRLDDVAIRRDGGCFDHRATERAF